MTKGTSTNHVDSMGGGRGSKMSKNDPRYTSKLIHVWGGEGSEKPKNRSTWFVDNPLWGAIIFSILAYCVMSLCSCLKKNVQKKSLRSAIFEKFRKLRKEYDDFMSYYHKMFYYQL